MSLLGFIGAAGIGGPFYVKETVLTAVSKDVNILQYQMVQVNQTLTKINERLEMADDWLAEQARVDARLRSLLKEETFKR
jgi:hypothetical protein